MTDIRLMPQDTVDAFEKEIDALLNVLGFPGALVTDASDFGDFFSGIKEVPASEGGGIRMGTKAERQAELDAMLEGAGITTKIDVYDTLVVGIRKLLADNPSWPKEVRH